ncbi:hypothetical protein [Azospirillum rugosum]|uniref:Transglutaminase-like superfamily protein n=1 Tax=Azospirillum rugosum TaxID=416170 RepID=A0ABS4SQ11_9PROT|nr:hypothetical protein [Azospirillum rugosum]MBP2294188.1 hypothetical protein [Azospirillum rugosum]MDQ0527423.1 hypothetical protein [Azospirillum rugosum]
MLLAMSAWMRLMLGEAEAAAPALASPLPGALPPERERIRRALHTAVTNHPLHRELVQVHGLGGCQYFAFAGAMALEALGLGRAEVALGRVAFRAGRPGGRPNGRPYWVGYPAARADVRVPDPAQERQEAEAFPFHAWIRLTGPDGRRCIIDFDLSNVLREVRLRVPGERFDLHPVATGAFWGSAMEARAAGLRFEVQRRMTADALLAGDRSVFEDIAGEACARLRP